MDVKAFLLECQSNAGDRNKEAVLGLITQIGQAVTLRNLEMNRMFSQHRVANSATIPVYKFAQEVRSIVSLSASEQDQLERAYRSLEGEGLINYVDFLQDVSNQTRTEVVLSKGQQQLYDGIRDLLNKHKMDLDLASRLKAQDPQQLGYITPEQLTRAVQDTLQAVPSQTKRQQLSSTQVSDLTGAVQTDSSGVRLNWHMFLTQLFGHQQAQQLISGYQPQLP